jgi:hypothetical protein
MFKKTVGEVGTVQTNIYDDFHLWFLSTSCNGTHVTYKRSGYEDPDVSGEYGNTTFKIEGGRLTKASVKDIDMPVFGTECKYDCTETCYAEIWGWGTCPPEPKASSCYTTECRELAYLGNARVSVRWKVPNRLGNLSLTESSSMYSYRSKGSTYMSKSRGSMRWNVPVTVKATLDGIDFFRLLRSTRGRKRTLPAEGDQNQVP